LAYDKQEIQVNYPAINGKYFVAILLKYHFSAYFQAKYSLKLFDYIK